MTTTLLIEQLRIPPTGIHLLTKIYINRKVARFVIDTGASQTVLDANRVQHYIPKGNKRKVDSITIGVGTNEMESAVITLPSLKLGTITTKDFEIVLLDLYHVNHSYSTMGFKNIDGILGSDLLKKFNAVINFNKLLLTLQVK